MDFDLDEAQTDRLHLLDALVRDCVDPRDSAGAYSSDLDEEIRASEILTGPDLRLLERVLLVEQAARLRAPISATTTLLLEPLSGIKRPVGAMAVRTGSTGGPLPYGLHATSLFEIDLGRARFGLVDARGISPVASGLGEGYAVLSVDESEPLDWPHRLGPLETYHLGLVAEVAGASRAALEVTTRFLGERRQFGQPLARFQALRHRLSERLVDVESTSVLARYAADTATRSDVACARAFATQTAALLVPEMHQLCGARGFLHEFGLAGWTLRVQALRVELGGVRQNAMRHASVAWE